MDTCLWKQLPADQLDEVLQFLPVPDLCRFRSVCKKWNSLISSPAFGKICIQNASKGANVGAFLVVKFRAYYSLNHINYLRDVPGWSIFDLNARRCYNIHTELPTGYDQAGPAMDGGLVCTFVDPFTEEQRREPIRIYNPITCQDRQTLIISNPVDGTFKVLPAQPMDRSTLTVSMDLKLLVESGSNTRYKIFLLNSGCNCHNLIGPWMCVYDSAVNQWRIPPNPPPEWTAAGNYTTSVMFQGLLYVLLRRRFDSSSRLYSFNHVDDSLKNTGVQFRQREHNVVEYDFCFCDLFVSDNRLFLKTHRFLARSRPEHGSGEWFGLILDISEIHLADKVCRTVVQLGNAEVREKFDISNFRSAIHAFGYDKSILLMCEGTGKVMLYDLVIGTWESLHPNPGERRFIRSM